MSSLNCDDTASIVTTSRSMRASLKNLRSLDKILLATVAVLSIICLALIISVGVQGSKLRHLENSPDHHDHRPVTPPGNSSIPVTPSSAYLTSGTTRPHTPPPFRPAPEPHKCPDSECNKVCLEPECVEAAGSMLQSLSRHIHPCQDFYEYACGDWGSVHLIPDTAARWDQFEMSRELVSRAINEVLMHDHDIALRPEPIQDAKKFYDDCMHQTNENNYTELKIFIDHMLVDFNKDLGTALGRLRRHLGANYLFTMKVDTDNKDASRNVIYMDQPYFVVPRSSILHPDHVMQAYTTLMIEVWAAVFGVSHTVAAETAANIMHFEQSMAMATAEPADRINETALYNMYTVEELYVLTETEHQHLNWDNYFEEVFAEIYDPLAMKSSWNKTKIVVRDTHYFHMLENLINDNDTSHTLHDYLTWRIIYDLIEDSTEELRDFYFNYQVATHEMESPLPMWRLCAAKTQEHFSMALTYYFVEEYFDEELKPLIGELVDEIKKTLRGSLQSNSRFSWMTKEVRNRVQGKLDSLKVYVGHPDWLTQPTKNPAAFTTGLHEYYYHLILDKNNNHFENIAELLEWKSKEDLKEIKKSNEYEKWVADPLDVAVVYWPKHNSLTITAGILQEPFYFGHSLQYLNFGAIGSLIAHSLVHVFDFKGRQHSADGSAGNIWDSETEAGYKTAVSCFESEFSNYTVEDEKIIIPWRQSLVDESVADNLGLKLAYKAYQSYAVKNGDGQILPGLRHTPEQLFYLAHAQMWCEVSRHNLPPEESAATTPPQFRGRAAFVNSPEFLEAWKCRSTGLQKPCHIW